MQVSLEADDDNDDDDGDNDNDINNQSQAPLGIDFYYRISWPFTKDARC